MAGAHAAETYYAALFSRPRWQIRNVVQSVTPEARVVYVGKGPIVLAHARALMTSTPRGLSVFIDAEVTDPDTILTAQTLHDTLDLSQLVAVSLIALLNFVSDAHYPYDIVARLVDAIAPVLTSSSATLPAISIRRMRPCRYTEGRAWIRERAPATKSPAFSADSRSSSRGSPCPVAGAITG